MSQVWHIFKKDARYLRGEIVLVAVMAAIFAYADSYGIYQGAEVAFGILFAFFSAFLIARVIHAEAIPGDRQFWITRPYRWSSLLSAKLLFILAFVGLPVAFAQLFIVIADGFSPGSILPGLLWSQVLILLVVALPIACVAAVTRHLSQFLFSLLAGVAAVPMCMSNRQFVGMLNSFRPSGVDWIRYSVIVAVAASMVTLILYVQYRHRQSMLARVVIIGGAWVVAALYLWFPVSWEMAVQTRLSPQTPASSIQVGIDSSKLRLSQVRLSDGRLLPWVGLDVRVATSGVPDRFELQADDVSATLEWPDGQRVNVDGNYRPGNYYDMAIGVRRALFNQEKEQPATIRVTTYLTLFGNEQTKTVPVHGTSAGATNAIQCHTGQSNIGESNNLLFCGSAFRAPDKLVYAHAGDGRLVRWWFSISYSPFPAELNLSPVDSSDMQISSDRGNVANVTIVTKDPVAHFRRDVELRGIRLADLPMTP